MNSICLIPVAKCILWKEIKPLTHCLFISASLVFLKVEELIIILGYKGGKQGFSRL